MTYCKENNIALNESLMRVWFRQLVLAIHCLHQNHIAHLDISAENVCIDARGQMKLIDFGVAVMHPNSPNHLQLLQYPLDSIRLRTNSSLDPLHFDCEPIPTIDIQLADGTTTRLISPPGKIRSMSPELFQHQPWNAYQSDAYSLGLVLYHMLTSRSAYNVPTLSDAWFQIFITGDFTKEHVRTHPEANRAYGHLSVQVLDLLSKLITDASKRLTPAEILQHPWMEVDIDTEMNDQLAVKLFIQNHSELFT
jgi:serine/threonine protein kinase